MQKVLWPNLLVAISYQKLLQMAIALVATPATPPRYCSTVVGSMVLLCVSAFCFSYNKTLAGLLFSTVVVFWSVEDGSHNAQSHTFGDQNEQIKSNYCLILLCNCLLIYLVLI